MLAGPPRQADMAVLDQHMLVGRRDIDVALPDRLPFSRMRSCQLAYSSQQIGQDAARLPDMGNDKHRSRMISGQGFRDSTQGVETACGSADYDYIAARRVFGAVSCHILSLRTGPAGRVLA